MYSEQELKKDLLKISYKYYVKYKWLEGYFNKTIDYESFRDLLSENKSDEQVNIIIQSVKEIHQKIALNGGCIDRDMLSESERLRKSGKLNDALKTILEYIKINPSDDSILSVFGWIIYDILKLNEENTGYYIKYIQIYNEYYDKFSKTDKYDANILTKSLIWSIRRVAKINESNANLLVKPFITLCKNHKITLKRRWIVLQNDLDPLRLIITDFTKLLNTNNFIELIDFFGLQWLDEYDYKPSSFKSEKGEVVVKPLAERILNTYAKKLVASNDVDLECVNKYIEVLEFEIIKNPKFIWLPYYKIKLLIKVGNLTQAYDELCLFAPHKFHEFWIWSLFCEIVDDKDKISFICKALLCNAKPEHIVELQIKAIQRFLDMKLFANAKFELDCCIATKERNGWNISKELVNWKIQEWYLRTNSVVNRDNLTKYANDAEKRVISSIPSTNIFISNLNKEKNVIHFYFIDSENSIKEGYSYIDSITNTVDWFEDKAYKCQMVENPAKQHLYNIFDAKIGDDSYAKNFISNSYGNVKKNQGKVYAFVHDTFIPPVLVQKYDLDDGYFISYIQKRKYDMKKQKWGWIAVEINRVFKSNEEHKDNELC